MRRACSSAWQPTSFTRIRRCAPDRRRCGAIRQGRPHCGRTGSPGDRPIMLAEIDDAAHLALVRQLLRAHEYLTLKNLPVDLVVINESSTSYVQDLQAAIESLARAGQQRSQQGSRRDQGQRLHAACGSHVRRITSGAAGVCARCARQSPWNARGAARSSGRSVSGDAPARSFVGHIRARREVPAANPALEMFNGIGGFAADGTEYVVVLGPGTTTPMPWINVIGQPDFGFQVSASGAGFTWSHEQPGECLDPLVK